MQSDIVSHYRILKKLGSGGIHNVSEKLEDIVAKALAKDREERYQSAMDLLIDLKRLKQRLEIAAEVGRSAGPEMFTDRMTVQYKLGDDNPTVMMSGPPTSSAEYIVTQIKRHKKIAIALTAILTTTIAGLAIWLYKSGFRISPASAAVLHPRPFANSAGYQEQSAFSPDGNQIAYAFRGEREEHSNLYVKLIDSVTQLQLTHYQDADASWPTWSPDGRRIAFIRTTKTTREIVTIPSLGGAERRLYSGKFLNFRRDEYGSYAFGNLSWSPDGKFIAFSEKNSEQDPFSILTGTPRWSPDGRYIAFDSRPEGSSDIYVIEAEGGTPRRVTTDDSQDVMPTWSRDGRWIYFTSNRGRSSFEIWKVPPEGGQAVQVTKNNGFYAFESPDGEFLYFSRSVMVGGVWRMPVEGGAEVLVVKMPPAQYWGHWAIVDTGIYFADPFSKPRASVQFFDFATKRTVPVAELQNVFTAAIPSFAISPDGKSLLFVLDDRLINSIMLVENFR